MGLLELEVMTRLILTLMVVTLRAHAGMDSERVLRARAEVDAVVMQISAGEAAAPFLPQVLAAKQPEYAARRLATALQHAVSPESRRGLSYLLAQLKTPVAEPSLVQLLKDPDPFIRMRAASGLGLFHSEQVHALRPLLEDPSAPVRREAAKALGASKHPETGPVLMEAARREPEPDVRAAMLTAVGDVRDLTSRRKLEVFLRHSSESARFAAATALCRLGAATGFSFIRARLLDADVAERHRAVLALAGSPLKGSGPLLRPLLKDPQAQVAATAARLLHEAGEPEMVLWLVVASFHAPAGAKAAFEDEIERLHLSDEERAALLIRAGLKVKAQAAP